MRSVSATHRSSTCAPPVDLVLGDLHEAVVVVGQQQLLGLARALRVDALADHRRARLLHERRRGDHRGEVRRAAARGAAPTARARRRARRSRRCGRGSCRSSRRRCRRRSARRTPSARRRAARAARGRSSRRRVPAAAAPRSGCRRPARGRTRRGSGSRRACPPGPVEQLSPITSTFSALERREHRGDVGAQQHLAAVGQQRDRGVDRQRPAGALEGRAGAEDRGLDLEDVLRRLDDDQVDAAVDQARRLLGEDLDQLAEADLPERRVLGGRQEAGRPDRARDEAALAGGLARDLGGPGVDLDRVLAEAPLLELQPRALEGVGLDALRRRPRASRRGRPRSRRGGSARAPRGTCPAGRRSPRSSSSNCSSVAPMPPS